MSLLKWTLIMASTAMGVRYMSDRHRRQLTEGGDRPAQADRDSSPESSRDSSRNPSRDPGRPADTPWSTPQGRMGLGGSSGALGSTGSSASSVVQDDLQSPGSTPAPGSSSYPF